MSERLQSIQQMLPQRATMALAVLVGICACVAGMAAADFPRNRLVFLTAAIVGIPFVALASGQAKRVFLFSWVVCLTYNRNYFFDLPGNNGSYGLYWNPSDLFLLALIGLWAYETIVRKRPLKAVGGRIWPWLLPFTIACFCSTFYAHRVDWVFYEMARVARIGLILAYVRYNVRKEDLWVCLAGFGSAIAIQALQGFVYVVTGTNFGLSRLVGAGSSAPGPLRLVTEGVTQSSEARRAMGTFGHPNTFACYLLLVSPVFLALATSPMRRLFRVLCGFVGVVAWIAIGVTLSRTSWVITLAQCGALVVGLTAFGIVKLKRALGVVILTAFIGALALVPLAGKIQHRLEGDFRGALDFRVRQDKIALQIWQTSPFFGVGLDNYSDTIAKYGDPDVDLYLSLGKYMREAFQIRVTAWVHNIYLLVLAETGILGLGAFLWFAIGTLRMGIRAVGVKDTIWKAASFGLLLGLLGVYAHGLEEAALWIDPVTYTFALVAGILNVIPAIVAPRMESADHGG